MQTATVLYILLAAIASLALVLFQYKYKVKGDKKILWELSLLRFLAVFGILLLFLNPKFERRSLSTEKPNLVVLADNSSSIHPGEGDKIKTVISHLQAAKNSLQEQFSVFTYTFGNQLKEGDSLTFSENNTNISQALSAINGVFGKTNTAVLLLTDGNQTLGEDYEFYGQRQNLPIYPMVVGDTTTYEDLAITRVNNNRYGFLNSKFPLEIFVTYKGRNSVTSQLQIFLNNGLVHQERISLSNTNSAKTVQVQLQAKSVGVKDIRVKIAPLSNEKNTGNNERRVAMEVLDEGTKIALISNMLHPDLGALKKIVESNEQRSLEHYKSSIDISEFNKVDLYILYQPDASFEEIYKQLALRKANYLTIGGNQTNWRVLTRNQEGVQVESGYPIQELFAISNPGFTKYDIANFSFDGFPPLESSAGPVSISLEQEGLLTMSSKGIVLESPLLTVMEDQGVRSALLLGENLWKWRLHAYREEGSFKNFDDFFGKLIFYLSTNTAKERFSLNFSPIYNHSNEAIIQATYYDKAFRLDPNASIDIKVKDSATNQQHEAPMLLKGNYFEADLRGLGPGTYSFTATVENENLNEKGSFTILDFEVEKQFTSSNYLKLQRLADHTGGKLFFPDQLDSLVQTLAADQSYVPTQISKLIIVSLVDFRIILGIIVLALTLEWIIRKFNGLT